MKDRQSWRYRPVVDPVRPAGWLKALPFRSSYNSGRIYGPHSNCGCRRFHVVAQSICSKIRHFGDIAKFHHSRITTLPITILIKYIVARLLPHGLFLRTRVCMLQLNFDLRVSAGLPHCALPVHQERIGPLISRLWIEFPYRKTLYGLTRRASFCPVLHSRPRARRLPAQPAYMWTRGRIFEAAIVDTRIWNAMNRMRT